MSYAADTKVSPEKSRAEIESLLRRYKAGSFGYATMKDGAVVMFEIEGRRVKFAMSYPPAASFMLDGRGRLRTHTQRLKAYDQAQRQRWRALVLVIKAKLEAVDAGITTVEEEFMAHIVLPDGRTMGEWARPQIARAYASGNMPPLLGGAG